MYSALIDGHGKHGLIDEAFGILREMLEAGVQPNIVTFNSLIDACARWGGRTPSASPLPPPPTTWHTSSFLQEHLPLSPPSHPSLPLTPAP